MPIVDAVFEHRMYLSLASVAVAVVLLGDGLLRAVRLGWLGPVVLVAVAVTLAVLTHLRNAEYRSRADVWTVAVERMPNSIRARSNLAQGLIVADRTAEVIPVLDRALELSPTDPTALQNQAAAYEQLGEFDAAAEYFRRLTAYYPANWDYWRMYAANLLVLGRWEEAADAYATAAELNRKAVEEGTGAESPEPHYGRAAALFALGRDDEARAEAGAASAISPDWPEAVVGIARNVILDEKMRDNPLARRSALTWARLGRRFIDHPHPQILDTLALCYAANGEFDQAVQVAREALLETPGGPWGSLHRDRLRYYVQKRVPWE
jgi:Flp pilus assembly protein TadD